MDGSTILAITDGSGNVKHWNMYGNELLGRQKANGDRRYYVYDHLGSTRQVVDANYDYIIQDYDYYPFGLLQRAIFQPNPPKKLLPARSWMRKPDCITSAPGIMMQPWEDGV